MLTADCGLCCLMCVKREKWREILQRRLLKLWVNAFYCKNFCGMISAAQSTQQFFSQINMWQKIQRQKLSFKRSSGRGGDGGRMKSDSFSRSSCGATCKNLKVKIREMQVLFLTKNEGSPYKIRPKIQSWLNYK